MLKKKALSILCGIAFLMTSAINVGAQVILPEKAVKGLPEGITAVDTNGNIVDTESGEYFFHAEDMVLGETYSMDISLMNLRSDKSYNIYFYVEPIDKSGEIDLEKGCECVFSLDGQQVYKGDVNGKGNIDLSENPLDLGLFNIGDSRVLNCSITWNSMEVDKHSDNGSKLVSADGTQILRPPTLDGSASGEIRFKWIFYAIVKEEAVPPDTGVIIGTSALALSFGAVCFAAVLIKKKKGQRMTCNS